jgi:NADPH:quinone reductase-like Zn-dependent oxidoreductase
MARTVLSPVDVVFDVIGREILKRSTELARPGGTHAVGRIAAGSTLNGKVEVAAPE